MIKLQPSKQELLEQIREEQKRRMSTIMEVGYTFQSSPSSIQAIQSRASLMTNGDLVPWVTADNGVYLVSKSKLEAIAAKAAKRNDKIIVRAAELKNRVNAGEYVDAKSDDNWT